jgi:hypothetical protein
VSKGTKILILVVLFIACSSAFTALQKNGPAELTALFAFMTVGMFVAICVVASSRGNSRRR